MNVIGQLEGPGSRFYRLYVMVKTRVAIITLLAILFGVSSYPLSVLAAVRPDPPTATGGEESVSVSNFTSGATLTLYLVNGTLIATEPNVTTASFTFENVVPNNA
ncbi:hypothetical protein, partial [Paenibacillus sp. y28]|uniref:hypothetical protein n=1 Tax=Paenibacillus sp. y28 TaxID=3129110 RepID=UPI0030193008